MGSQRVGHNWATNISSSQPLNSWNPWGPSHPNSYLFLSTLSPASQVVLMVKNPSLNAGNRTKFQTMGQEDPPEKGMATHFSIIAWRTPQTEEPGRLWSIVFQRVRHDWNDLAHTSTIFINIIRRLFSPKERQTIQLCFIFKIHPCCFWKLQQNPWQ